MTFSLSSKVSDVAHDQWHLHKQMNMWVSDHEESTWAKWSEHTSVFLATFFGISQPPSHFWRVLKTPGADAQPKSIQSEILRRDAIIYSIQNMGPSGRRSVEHH